MSKQFLFSIGCAVLFFVGLSMLVNQETPIALGAPDSQSTRHILPFTDSTYDIGTSSLAYRQGYFDELCLTADTCYTSIPSGGGGGGGLFVYESNGDYIYLPNSPTTTPYTEVRVSSFVATSTATSSQFNGGFTAASSTFTSTTRHQGTSTWEGDVHPVMHGIYANDSSGLHLHANGGTEVAYFGAGGGANVTLPGYTSALLQTGSGGAVAEYAGTTCTNQFVRALSALGIATCESVDIGNDTDLVAGTNITLTGSTLDVDDAFLLNTGDTGTGNYTFSSGQWVIGTSSILGNSRLTLFGTTTMQAATDAMVLRLQENAGGEYFDIKVDANGDVLFNNDAGQNVMTLGDASGDVLIGFDLVDVNDTNTYLDFSTADDNFAFFVGGVEFMDFTEDVQDVITINANFNDIDLIYKSASYDLLSIDGGTDTATLLGTWNASNATLFQIPTSTDPSNTAAGSVAFNTSSTSIEMGDGSIQYVLSPYFDKSMELGSTTYDTSLNSFDTGTTTRIIWCPTDPVTLTDIHASTTAGTLQVRIGDGANWSEVVVADGDGQEDDGSITNGTFIARECVRVQAGTQTSNPDGVVITATFRKTP